jgi:hypothetical protein
MPGQGEEKVRTELLDCVETGFAFLLKQEWMKGNL